jgi:hypothetical protein
VRLTDGNPRKRSRFDLAELRDAADHDGESATTVYIGGPGWEAVRALVAVADAANGLTTINVPRGRKPPEWYAAMDRLLAALDQFENRS